MAKLPSIEHVKFVKRGERVYAYFNTGQKVGGKAVYKRLPDYDTSGFWESYAAFRAGRTRRGFRAYTVADLAHDYLSSTELGTKAENTQRIYRLQTKKVVRCLGKFAVDDLAGRHIRIVLDGEGWAPGTRNAFVSMVGTIYQWGRRRGKTSGDPAKDIERVKGGQHEPWPDDVLEAALTCDDPVVRLAVHLFYFTGQRMSDVRAMRWNDIKRDVLHVRQIKTGKELFIPLPADLKAELARTPKTAITIMGHISEKRLRTTLQAFVEGFGIKRNPHGLRKNAVNTFLLAGCSHEEVASITGQTIAMVTHYAARVNRRKLAESAVRKFDEGRLKQA